MDFESYRQDNSRAKRVKKPQPEETPYQTQEIPTPKLAIVVKQKKDEGVMFKLNMDGLR